ncbi:hypothetical protein SHI21_04055 [Bacteriovorax sp. PP10]|uniref:Uncharacterized protein n=1 Tax=Bacteriovorax antarcticus TaxID=3088717 RepID=A0ABU5VQP4_9BACT|nr:hypothetical protein [Bacteriovorax sp. PP10]MEA9355357.1 hypothetical protein [Bacteriovorax sp. PP10]
MKSFLLFFTLLALNLPAYASAKHTCFPENSNANISQVTIEQNNNNYVLSIFYKLRPVEEITVEYYDDITYMGYSSDMPQYDLLFSDQNNDSIWTDATLSYGNNFDQRLKLFCY